MHHPSLEGHAILVVEDQPLIAMLIALAFETTGASVTTTNTLEAALLAVENGGLSGAILDHALGEGDTSQLGECLTVRDIPFMIYSGHPRAGGICRSALHIEKPATPETLVAAMEGLILGDVFADRRSVSAVGR